MNLNYIYLKIIARQKLRGQNIDVPAIFRPSTGALALVLALRDFPRAARYIISGIGFSGRSVYPEGIGASEINNKYEVHVMADKKLFSRLVKHHPLYTTDLELSAKTGIPML